VSTLTEVTSIAAGAEHALALLASGSVMAWGADGKGQLGNGVFKARQETPVAVSGISGVTAISAGGQDSAAVVGSGSVMAWGANKWGTLGNGETGSPSNVPVGVSGLRKVSSLSVGGAHMLAFGEPIPVITSVSPNVGPTGGGTTVTISGTGFAEASAVKFGAAEATGVSVISATSITATAPAGTGVVDVTVTTPSGISPTGPPDRFTYQPAPIVAKLSPKSGPTPGATSVTISGSDFTGATAVKFGEASAVSFKVNSATSITAISPPGEVGNVDVRVSTPGGTSAAQTGDRFKYTPVVQAITPNGGPIAGGTSVTVTGSGFALGSTGTLFKFGKVKAKSVECASSTSCTMITPAEAPGAVNVTATVAKVTSPVNEPGDHFTYS
ncbi:MAG: IPT/TIG domain-containing protein, partial [Actinomycetota bacterium]|nr:IPT/TIG domain-containing protein [Actinomycetota bacterium]